QLLFAAIVPLENEIDGAPATGENVGVPEPGVGALGGFATTIAPGTVGRLSVKLTPLREPALAFVRVNVSVEIPPTFVGFGEKLLEIVASDGSMIVAMRALLEKSL